MSFRRRVAAGMVFVVAGAVTAIGCCTPQLATWMITPRDPFDVAKAPAAPDYSRDDAWLALPSTADEADVALPELPIEKSPAVDVFYLHSTSSVAAAWNARWDDPEVRTASIRGGTLIQGSVFNGCCAVYAPEYRQASGHAFTHPSPDGDRAIAIASADVNAAFDEFLKRTGGARPFILAGHSQGSWLTAKLLRERIANGPERARLVAVYIPGVPLTRTELGGLDVCTAPEQTGCVVTYNARGATHVKNELDFDTGIPEEGRLCVNPTTGAATTELVSRTQHGGAVFFDAEKPAVLPAFLASQCQRGRLVVTEMEPIPKRDAMSGILLQVMGGQNFHPVEYQIFYVDLREDARRRARAFKPEG